METEKVVECLQCVGGECEDGIRCSHAFAVVYEYSLLANTSHRIFTCSVLLNLFNILRMFNVYEHTKLPRESQETNPLVL